MEIDRLLNFSQQIIQEKAISNEKQPSIADKIQIINSLIDSQLNLKGTNIPVYAELSNEIQRIIAQGHSNNFYLVQCQSLLNSCIYLNFMSRKLSIDILKQFEGFNEFHQKHFPETRKTIIREEQTPSISEELTKIELSSEDTHKKMNSDFHHFSKKQNMRFDNFSLEIFNMGAEIYIRNKKECKY
jgi:hypothetical protein